MARMSLVNCFLLGALTAWPALAAPPSWAVAVGFAVALLLLFLQGHRLRRNIRYADLSEDPDRLALVPVLCVVVAFLGYGLTLAQVHTRYYDRRTREYERVATRYDRRLTAETARLSRENTRLQKAAKQKEAGLHALRRTRARSEKEIRDRTRRGKREAAEVTRFYGILATVAKRHKHFARPGLGGRARSELTSLIRRAHFARHGYADTLASSLLLLIAPPGTRPPIPEFPPPPVAPRASDLPPWFGRLGGFFTVSTQLLAGLAIVLAFTRWRSGVSEAVWRTAMPVAAAGVAFGLAGNLPSLSRELQAILLGPVLAGLAAAVGALIVATVESRPSASASV